MNTFHSLYIKAHRERGTGCPLESPEVIDKFVSDLLEVIEGFVLTRYDEMEPWLQPGEITDKIMNRFSEKD